MSPPIHEFGGEGPVIQLAVANGFPPQTYAPMLRPLTNRYRVVCLPPRALWPGSQPPQERRDWRMLAEDLLNGMREHNLTDVIAIGHSFGGVASLLAAIQEPRRFRALCLMDVTILPPPALEYMRQFQEQNVVDQIPLVQSALRRRRRFESVEAAYANFKTKPIFSDWPEETLRLYAVYGTRPVNGNGVELTWPPEWEAYYFSTMYTHIWHDLPNLHGLCPLLILRGATSDTLLPETVEQLRALLPDMVYGEIAGGHLFPQTAPEATSCTIIKWLDTLP